MLVYVKNLETGEVKVTDRTSDYLSFTFAPVDYTTIWFNANVGNYSQNKAAIRKLAAEILAADTDGLTYGEESLIAWFFETHGRYYGLTREFRAMGILA